MLKAEHTPDGFGNNLWTISEGAEVQVVMAMPKACTTAAAALAIFRSPSSISPLDEAKAALAAAVNAKRDAVISGGFKYNFGSTNGIRILDQRDARDETAWLTVKISAMDLISAEQGATLIPMRDSSNSTFAPSATVADQAMSAMAAWRQAVSAHSWALKDEIVAAPDQPALGAIEVDANWPG